MKKETSIKQAYDMAVERYAAIGVNVKEAIKQLQDISLSLHCWQTDDVTGFENLVLKIKTDHSLEAFKLQAIIRDAPVQSMKSVPIY